MDGEHSAEPNRQLETADLVEVMRRIHGLDISCYDTAFLLKAIERRWQTATAETSAAYLERVAQDRAEAEALVDSLQIHFSEFFRDPLTFALVEQRILPGLVAASEASDRRELRIWSAGCSTGQEAYSLAILLVELSGARERPISFRLFATDRCEAQIAQARAGAFPASAMHNVRLGHLQRWFRQQGSIYVAAPELRERVDFSVHDLLDERSICPPASIFGDFDLVVCCNVLLYYQAEDRQRILDKLQRCLVGGGYLVTGEAERDPVQNTAGFRAMATPASVFQKGR